MESKSQQGSQTRQRHYGDHECDRAGKTSCLSEVEKGDWSHVPANQMEEVQQRTHVPCRHQGGGSQGEDELDKESDKEKNQRIKRILQKGTPAFSTAPLLSVV